MLCSTCTKGSHVYCLPSPLNLDEISHWDDPQAIWECPECSSLKQDQQQQIISMRFQNGNLEYLLCGRWKNELEISQDLINSFLISPYRMISLGRLNHGGLFVIPKCNVAYE